VEVRGNGFLFELPQGWTVERPPKSVVGKHGSELVSVTRFDLRKAYDPKQFGGVAKTLDSVAARLAKAAGTTITDSKTATVAGEKIRAYRYGGKRIGFVLDGKREYQLFCGRDGEGCELLFDSFTLSDGPPS